MIEILLGPVDEAMVAANIKELRISSRYSQKEIAVAMSMTQQAYSKIESGRTKISLEFLIGFARIIKVHPALFFIRIAVVPGEKNDDPLATFSNELSDGL